MRVPAGNDACPAGTTGARGQVEMVKYQPLPSHTVDRGALYLWVAVTAQIIPADVVCDDQDDIWPIRRQYQGHCPNRDAKTN